jgi:NPCBM-associated, NEW3 domain of alpha-galactosidase
VLGAPASCVRAAPAVSIVGGSTAVSAGAQVNYTVSVTNRDSAACAASAYALQASVPAQWSGSFASSSLSLQPGAGATTSLTVGSAAGAAAGSYSIGVAAASAAAPSLSGSSSGNFVVAATAAQITVVADKAVYLRNETVRMTSRLSSGGAPVVGGGVTFTLVKADGENVVQSASTDGNGVASSSYRISRKDRAGAWQLKAAASLSGTPINAASGFTVK